MKAIVLAAGPGSTSLDERERLPKCLLPYSESGTILDTLLAAFQANGISEIAVVGGFELLKVMEAYPSVKHYYNERWESTGSLYSLSKAASEFDDDLLVSFSDIVYGPAAVDTISRSDADFTVAYDSTWETRYGGRVQRVLDDAVKVFVDDRGAAEIAKHAERRRCLGEFVGLILIKRRVASALAPLMAELLREDPAAHVGLLAARLSPQWRAGAVDVEGRWAELDSPQDLFQFRFGTKAETLARLQQRLSKARVLPQVTFTVGEFARRPDEIITRIRTTFDAKRLVVRSSAADEDTFSLSMAGKYTSVLHVSADSAPRIREAVDAVCASYLRDSSPYRPEQQVLVQPQIEGCILSGVAFTQDLETGAGYYTMNYTYGERTDTVTAGNADGLRTFVCFKSARESVRDHQLQRVLDVLVELEEVTAHEALDVEFAVTLDDVFVLQARPIAAQKDAYRVYDKDVRREVSSIKHFLALQQGAVPGVVGRKTAYGVMPDWNPAEIIGINPGPLAFSLYRHLITDRIWPESRRMAGYRDTSYNPGIVSLGGKPYVDVRMSFNSFTPRALPEPLAAKLVDHSLDVLRKHPELHDKVEFAVALTAYDLSFPKRMGVLRGAGFDHAETAMIEEAYRSLTNDIVCGRVVTIDEALRKVGELEARRAAVLAAPISPEAKIVKLLEDCKTHGTLPFSILARYAFVGAILLSSLLAEGHISHDEYDAHCQTVRTVAKEFLDDWGDLATGRLAKEAFLDRYGHLRPGTYDVRSRSYREAADVYLNVREPLSPNRGAAFHWESSRLSAVDAVLAGHGLEFDARSIFAFTKEATEARERAKFEFSKNLSAALDLIVVLAQELGFSREDAAFLEIEDVFRVAAGSRSPNVEKELGATIRYNQERHRLTAAVKLPELIFSPSDVDAFHVGFAKPNFITQKTAIGSPVVLSAQQTPRAGEIAFIENADPGYDWIFCHPIAGLVTKYGGVASHMAIRCAELGIPAAIGAGELLFEQLRRCAMVRLDCCNQTLGPMS